MARKEVDKSWIPIILMWVVMKMETMARKEVKTTVKRMLRWTSPRVWRRTTAASPAAALGPGKLEGGWEPQPCRGRDRLGLSRTWGRRTAWCPLHLSCLCRGGMMVLQKLSALRRSRPAIDLCLVLVRPAVGRTLLLRAVTL